MCMLVGLQSSSHEHWSDTMAESSQEEQQLGSGCQSGSSWFSLWQLLTITIMRNICMTLTDTRTTTSPQLKRSKYWFPWYSMLPLVPRRFDDLCTPDRWSGWERWQTRYVPLILHCIGWWNVSIHFPSPGARSDWRPVEQSWRRWRHGSSRCSTSALYIHGSQVATLAKRNSSL